MKNSKIAWTTHTFNPWVGCSRCSPACEHCYAETTAGRRYGLAEWGAAVAGGTRHVTGRAKWQEPYGWNREAHATCARARVFCASWADVFDDFDGLTNVGTTLDSERERLWSLIDATPHLDWLLLTKRPQSIGLMIPARWRDAMPTNVWLGCTVEDQRNADERIPQLIQYPSVVRFVSIEPQLGPIDLSKYLRSVNWIIAGGESGAGSRPMEVAWARSIRDQAVGAGVSFFFKQWGNHVQVASTEQLVRVRAKDERTLDGRIWEQIPTPRLVATRPAPELAPRRLTEPTVIPTLVAMKTELLTAFASSCRGAYQIAGAYLAGSQLSLEERAKALYEGFSLALPSNMRKWAKANVTQAELTATVEANYKP